MHNYCSVISKDYIHRGLMLYHSLKMYDNEFKFFFVCLNNEVKSLLQLMELDRAIVLTIEQIENQDPELAAVKASRNSKEYAWTTKASVFLYLFNNYPELEHIVWLDSDMVFYSSPEPIFEELNACSILLTKERFSETHMDLNNIYGIFNTGLMGFKRDSIALSCIQTYRRKCIDWCYDVVMPGKWSDQMYVNYWPWIYKNVRVIENIGINATAWNIQGLSICLKEGDIYIEESKLVFYHYSGFRYNNYSEYDLCCYIDIPETAKNLLYIPYVEKYQTMIDTVNKHINNFYNGMNYKEMKYRNYYGFSDRGQAKAFTNCFCTITTNGYLLKCLALYDSMKKHTGENFHLWICTIDVSAYELLLKLKLSNATIVKVEEIENEALLHAKNNRYQNEYCWTIKASLIKYVLIQYPSIESILYVDSDIYLFSNPSSLFENLRSSEILLTSHNFTQGFYHLNEQKGKYNAGIVGFKNSKKALLLLDWWEKRCIEWCYNQIAPNKFADQKYLETLGVKYPRAVKIKSLGVNAAMWNIENKSVTKNGENIYINNNILVLYHFSSFYIINEREFDLWKSEYGKLDNEVTELIYLPYLKALKAAIRQVKKHVPDLSEYMYDKKENDVFYNPVILS